jgi:uncharacterized protein YaaW (UPF0174 family)
VAFIDFVGSEAKKRVDELRHGLELASQEELQAITELLFRPKFNPLDYWYTPDPIAVQSCDRNDQLNQIEQRFRYLAADGLSILKGQSQHYSYRRVLIQICHYLKFDYQSHWSTNDLEAEIYLKLLERTWQKLPRHEQKQLQQKMQSTLAQSEQFGKLPPRLQVSDLGTLLKGGGALAVSTVIRPWLLTQIANQFAWHFARQQVAQQALKTTATLAAQVQGKAMLHIASRGMAVNAARYGAMRSMLGVLGPAMWAWFLADIGWRAIATNYTRIIPVVFTLAQIRLTRDLEQVATPHDNRWEAA